MSDFGPTPGPSGDPDGTENLLQRALRFLARLLSAPSRLVPPARAARIMLHPAVADRIVETVASVNVYYTPILVALGSVGNLISVYVFYSSKLRLLSTSQYLTALAISDTVFLMQLLPPWLTAVRGDGLFQAPVFCQVFVYASYVSSCLSSWLVVAFTVERFVAVMYPLRRSAVCTRARARLVVCLLAGGAALLNLPVLRFAQPSRDNCSIDDAYLGYAALFNILDALLAFTVPLSAIVLLNAWIVYGVLKMRGSTVLPPCPRSQQRVTTMLLIVSTVFVAFNLPAYTIRIIAYARDMREHDNNATWEAVQQLALMFFNTNYGINFLLYCLSGQNFRSALRVCVGSERAQRAAVRSASCGPPLRALPSTNAFNAGWGGGGGGGHSQLGALGKHPRYGVELVLRPLPLLHLGGPDLQPFNRYYPSDAQPIADITVTEPALHILLYGNNRNMVGDANGDQDGPNDVDNYNSDRQTKRQNSNSSKRENIAAGSSELSNTSDGAGEENQSDGGGGGGGPAEGGGAGPSSGPPDTKQMKSKREKIQNKTIRRAQIVKAAAKRNISRDRMLDISSESDDEQQCPQQPLSARATERLMFWDCPGPSTIPPRPRPRVRSVIGWVDPITRRELLPPDVIPLEDRHYPMLTWRRCHAHPWRENPDRTLTEEEMRAEARGEEEYAAEMLELPPPPPPPLPPPPSPPSFPADYHRTLTLTLHLKLCRERRARDNNFWLPD